MKAKLILNNKEYEVEVSEEQVKEIEKPKYKRWRAKKYNTYFTIHLDSDVCEYTEFRDVTDNFLYSIGNYFKNKKEAEEYKKKLLYQQQYKDFIGEDLTTKEDWAKNPSLQKYAACIDHYCNEVTLSSNTYYELQGVIYSKSKEKIQDFIKKIGEDNFKKYILEKGE